MLALACSSDERDSYEEGIHEWANSGQVDTNGDTNSLPGGGSIASSSSNGSGSGSGSGSSASPTHFDRERVYVFDDNERGAIIVPWNAPEDHELGFNRVSSMGVIHGDDLIFWGSSTTLYRFVADEGSPLDYPENPLSNDIKIPTDCVDRGLVLSDPDSSQFYISCGLSATHWKDEVGNVLELPAGYSLEHIGYGGQMLGLSGGVLGVFNGPDDATPVVIPNGGLIVAIRAVSAGFWVVLASGQRYTIKSTGDFEEDGEYPDVSTHCQLEKDGTLVCLNARTVTTSELGASSAAQHTGLISGTFGQLVTGP